MLFRSVAWKIARQLFWISGFARAPHERRTPPSYGQCALRWGLVPILAAVGLVVFLKSEGYTWTTVILWWFCFLSLAVTALIIGTLDYQRTPRCEEKFHTWKGKALEQQKATLNKFINDASEAIELDPDQL